MSRLYLGTSGWSYPSGYGKWTGVFYPRGRAADELSFYAERFPSVEVNSSFYRLPAPSAVRGWVQRTPPGFRFAVKLYQKFTHPDFFARASGQSPEITGVDVAAMREVLDILAETDRLGALLVQYPDFFVRGEATFNALRDTLAYFRDYPMAVELRNRSWERADVAALLGDHRAARARIDEPFFSNLDAPDADTDGVQYWRFHGRNDADWRRRDAGARRYDYYYTPDEVDALADAIARKVNPDRSTFIFFNNHPGGQAAANAISLAKRLKMPLDYAKFSHLAAAFPDLRGITGDEGGQATLF